MSQDVWAAAANKAQATSGQQNSGESQLADGGYAESESQLFNDSTGAGPSIINKTHKVGTKRTGIIAEKPYDRQSTNVAGKPKFWQDGSNKPVLDAVNPLTGQPNRKVMDTILVLDTDYVMDAAEARAINRDAPFEGGRRSYTAGGEKLKLLKAAMKAFNESPAANKGKPISSGADMVGLRFTVERVGEKPNPNGGESIKIEELSLSRD